MPRLRNFGNVMSDMGSTLLQHALRLQAQRSESELVRQRQQELAGYNNELRRGQAEDTRRQQTLDKILGDPTGGVAQALVDAGETEWSPYAPKAEKAIAGVGSDIEKFTKREELPTDIGLEPLLANRPGGRMAAKDPIAIETLMAQRNAKRGAIDEAASAGITDMGKQAFAQAEGQGMGQEAAAAANYPKVLEREKNTFAQMTPLHTRRAAASAQAQQSAQTAGEAARIKQAWELAAQDPVTAGIAESVLAGTPIKEVPAAHRGYVMAALKSDKYRPIAAKRSKEILDTSWNALQRMKGNPSGQEGFTGNSFMDLFQRNPVTGTGWGGTPTADFQSNFEQFKAASSLEKIEFIRGMGHMSDTDLAIIGKAATHLGQTMGTPTFASGMAEAEAAMLRSYKAMGMEPPPSVDTRSPAQQRLDAMKARRGGVN